MVDWSETKFHGKNAPSVVAGLLGPALDAFTIFWSPRDFFFWCLRPSNLPFQKGSRAKFGDDGEV